MIEEQVNEDISIWQGVGVDGDGGVDGGDGGDGGGGGGGGVDVKMAADMIGYGGRYYYSCRLFLISKSYSEKMTITIREVCKLCDCGWWWWRCSG